MGWFWSKEGAKRTKKKNETRRKSQVIYGEKEKFVAEMVGFLSLPLIILALLSAATICSVFKKENVSSLAGLCGDGRGVDPLLVG